MNANRIKLNGTNSAPYFEMKWLELLHGVIQILRNDKDEWMRPLVSFLSQCWNYPERISVRIKIGNSEYISSPFTISDQTMISSLNLENGESGVIEISGSENNKWEIVSEEQEVLDSIAEMLGFAIDARLELESTHKKEAAVRSSHERIKDLAGRLIQAQEIERTRIARELHDNVNQQIAALSLCVSNIKKKLNLSETKIVEDLSLFQQKLSEIAEEVRGVSHNLHSGVLQHAGLIMAARSICAEFSAANGIEVEFNAIGDVDSVSKDIALCAYRVIQESIHNIQIHAHARHVKVSLSRSSTTLSLLVSDDGYGFDQNKTGDHLGLGLLSMNERVRQLHGQIFIDSRLSQGTQISVDIPV
jgi:signal transduction histidine kinase